MEIQCFLSKTCIVDQFSHFCGHLQSNKLFAKTSWHAIIFYGKKFFFPSIPFFGIGHNRPGRKWRSCIQNAHPVRRPVTWFRRFSRAELPTQLLTLHTHLVTTRSGLSWIHTGNEKMFFLNIHCFFPEIVVTLFRWVPCHFNILTLSFFVRRRKGVCRGSGPFLFSRREERKLLFSFLLRKLPDMNFMGFVLAFLGHTWKVLSNSWICPCKERNSSRALPLFWTLVSLFILSPSHSLCLSSSLSPSLLFPSLFLSSFFSPSLSSSVSLSLPLHACPMFLLVFSFLRPCHATLPDVPVTFTVTFAWPQRHVMQLNPTWPSRSRVPVSILIQSLTAPWQMGRVLQFKHITHRFLVSCTRQATEILRIEACSPDLWILSSGAAFEIRKFFVFFCFVLVPEREEFLSAPENSQLRNNNAFAVSSRWCEWGVTFDRNSVKIKSSTQRERERCQVKDHKREITFP